MTHRSRQVRCDAKARVRKQRFDGVARFTERWSEDVPELRSAIEEQMRFCQRARHDGNFGIAATIAGEAVDMVQSIQPGSEIEQSMVDQCDALLARTR